jgi:hypothetical protein
MAKIFYVFDSLRILVDSDVILKLFLSEMLMH